MIELLVTVAILAILLAVAAPGFQDFFANNRAAAASSDFIASLNLARSEATKLGQRVAVCKSAAPFAATPVCVTSGNWTSGRLVFVDTNANGVRESTEALLQTYGPLASGTLVGASGVHVISFTAIGKTTLAADTTVTLCVSGKQRQIMVGKMGRVRVVEGTC